MKTPYRLQEDHIVEGRLAARLASALNGQLQSLPHDVSERLRFARDQAVSRAREVRQAAPVVAPGQTTVVGVGTRGAAVLGHFVPWWQRAASVIPLVMLVLGFLAIDHWAVREQVLAAADFDTQLLADDLPPAAYSDPGFAEFLRAAPAP